MREQLINLPDWIPFACLITGKLVRKPMFTSMIEKLVIGIVAGIISFYGSYRVLETDVVLLKQNINEIQSQRAERRKQLDQDRNEVIYAMQRMEHRFDRLEDCIRLRTCTK